MYLFFDTETTGIRRYQDRVVQAAWILAHPDGTVVSEKSCIIKPEGFSIPAAASNIHGITTAYARSYGEPLDSVLHRLSADVELADTVVAHNINFDLSILEYDYQQAFIPFPFPGKTRICTMKLSTAWCRLPKLNGQAGFKYPKLVELHYQLFGESFDGAHDALEDVRACMRCFFKLVDINVIVLPSRAAGRTASRQPTNSASSTTNHNAPKGKDADTTGYGTTRFFQRLASSATPRMRERAASDANCPETVLLKLCQDSDLGVLKALVSNPASGSSVLGKIVDTENGEEVEIRRGIAAHPNCPAEVLSEWLNTDDDLDLAMARNPVCPPQILAELKWTYDPSSEIAQAAINNPNFSHAAYVGLVEENVAGMDTFERCDAAVDSVLPEELAVLAKDTDPRVRLRVAGNSHTPEDVLLQLSGNCRGVHRRCRLSDSEIDDLYNDLDAEVDAGVVEAEARRNHSNLICRAGGCKDPEALAQLSWHADSRVRCAVARNAETPKALLHRVAEDADANVRKAVAENPKASPATLDKLTKDADSAIRLLVAKSNRASEVSLVTLEEDPSVDVRRAVAENPDAPQQILGSLANDTDWGVIQRVITNPSTSKATIRFLGQMLEGIKGKANDQFFERIAGSPGCPRILFPFLCAHENPQTRKAAATNPRCSADGIRVLAASPIYEWRELAAQQPKCPPDVFRVLAQDKIRSVRKAVAENETCPMEIRAPLFMALKSKSEAAS